MISEGLNLTTFLAVIIVSILVFGFLPTLSFLLIILKVPKEVILILLSLINSVINVSKKLFTKES